MKKFILIIVFFLNTALFADWGNEQKLIASDGAAYDYFGNSIAIDGDYAVIGAWKDGDSWSMSGSAYIFHKSGTSWTQQAKITALDSATEDYFGYSVSISGDYAVIGAYGDDDNGAESGSAYIFYRNGSTWIEQAKITATDGLADDRFGCSVSISGDYAIVGAWGDDDYGIDRGSAYIFYRSGTDWIEQAKLTAPDGMDEDLFGYSVSISGDYAIVGSHYDDDNGSESGSAYIFYRSGTNWTEQIKLTAPDGAAYDWFGYTVSINGDYAAIGAHWDDDNGSNSGSAYLFNRIGTLWTQQAKITADDGSIDDEFGRSISIDGDYVVVGSCHDDGNGIDRGSAYIFHRNGTNWSQQAKITASDGADFDYFGCPVSISGNHAVIAANYDDDNGVDSGSAYIYYNDVAFVEEYIPDNKILLSNHPNPFNPLTNIQFDIRENEKGVLSIFNIKGQLIESHRFESGKHNYLWDATEQASGIYLYKLQTQTITETRKMLLLK